MPEPPVQPQPISWRDELRDTLRLAWPIVLSQVGNVSMGIVDTLVAGRISTNALAGLGFAANYYWTITSVCIGCLFALDTYFSQAAGAKDERALARYFAQSLWLCGLVTLACVILVVIGGVAYLHFSPPSGINDAFRSYVFSVVWSVPSIFLFFIMQRYWQAQHRVLAFTLIIVLANVLNLVGNLALGLGWWGFPRLEVLGLALSTVIGRSAMLMAAAGYTWWLFNRRPPRLERFDLSVQRQFWKLGWPAAGHTAMEVGAFGLATALVASLGAVSLAAHHVCLMMAATTFMFALGLSNAAAVRVGRFVGAGEPAHARVAGWISIGLAVAVMACFAAVYLLMPRRLLMFFSDDPAVIETGLGILFLVALFQIADGVQVSATGALRGIGNTRAAFLANVIGHFPIGIALGVTLCFGLNYGVTGMWVGLAAGLASVGAILLFTWHHKTRDLSQLKRAA
jgi:MATE family multidrug resistance protein